MTDQDRIIKSGKALIGPNKPVFIIAEIGGNHCGKLPLALKMVDAAVSSGADAVKFQTYRTEELAVKTYPGYRELKKEELAFSDFNKLSAYCLRRRIVFLSTPFDTYSVDSLERLHTPIFKISSGDIDNMHLIRYIAKKKKTVLLSTGASTFPEIACAVALIKKYVNRNMVLLHCVSAYPAPYREMNLNVLPLLAKRFRCIVGLSDHTQGIEVPLAAVALGAKVIEKHFTMDRSLPGGDNHISVLPQDFKRMVAGIRNIEDALGRPEKKVTASELKIFPFIRRGIVASKTILKGQVFTEQNIALKRPAMGVSAMRYHSFIGTGKRARRDIRKDEYLSKRD